MKGIFGSFLLMAGVGGIVGYAQHQNYNQFLMIGFFIMAAIGLDLAVSDMIDSRIKTLKKEILDEMDR